VFYKIKGTFVRLSVVMKYMSQFNIIAVLGFYLICSPQVFGQDGRYIGTHLAIEKSVETPVSTEKKDKIFPFPKKRFLVNFPVSKNCPKIAVCEKGFHETHLLVVDFRQFTFPKIIEEAA
jgi:hypothetical protein